MSNHRQNPSRPVVVASATALTLASILGAQSVHTVGGNSPDFNNIVDALASTKVRDGDTLQVRRGFYLAPDINKGVSILGEAGSALVLQKDTTLTSFDRAMAIRGIGKGKALALRNFTIYYGTPVGGFLRLSDCAGQVDIENVSVRFSLTSLFRGQNGDIEIRNCACVTLRHCVLDGLTQVDGSNLAASDCTFTGWHGDVNLKGVVNPATAGVDVRNNSQAILTRARSTGGNGARGTNSTAAPAAGVSCDRSTLTVNGPTTTSIIAGTLTGSSAPALRGSTTARLYLDPRCTLTPSGNSKKHEGFATSVERPLPALAVAGGDLGLALQIDLDSPADELFHIVAGLRRADAPLAVVPFVGTLWLDPQTLIFLGSGKQTTAGLQLKTTLPASKALVGFGFCVQAISGPATGPFYLTNPQTVVLR